MFMTSKMIEDSISKIKKIYLLEISSIFIHFLSNENMMWRHRSSNQKEAYS